MREFSRFYINDPGSFNGKLLTWSRSFSDICILNSNGYRKIFKTGHTYHSYDLIAAIGSVDRFLPDEINILQSLEIFIRNAGDWLFGHLSYDLKNEIEKLTSRHPDRINFPIIHLFIPEYIFILNDKILDVGWCRAKKNSKGIESILDEIKRCSSPDNSYQNIKRINNVVSRQDYLKTVKKIKDHIKRGDIYEVNYCQEFISENAIIDPPAIWLNLIDRSPTPFSCYYKINGRHLMCASPERFIKKSGNMIVSQPIKGTSRRGRTEEEDRIFAKVLQNDPKERAENIMITDLVRNDISKFASRASVRVDELCRIYPFPGVHQMQSTISATVEPEVGFSDILKAVFPMGSMTGAPKVRAMQIIEQYEKSKRGLYSGSVGYINPEMDFDFNVVIRSIQYNQPDLLLSFMAGGAITCNSLPEKEYRECLLKADAILRILERDQVLRQNPGDFNTIPACFLPNPR